MKKNKMFKVCAIIITFFIAFTTFNPIVFAAETFELCQKSGVVKSFQILGWCLLAIKIIVPILLIIMGSIDFGKAVISSDDNAIKNAINILIKRSIAAVVIFFIPTIISAVISLVDGSSELKDYDCLRNCISEPKTCEIPAGGVFGGVENEKS